MAVGVVPFEGDAAIKRPSPICFDFVVCAERVNEVVRMLFVDIFDTKIVHGEGELDWACDMFP